MSYTLSERCIDCPYCGESIDILIDASAGGQSYIEDCQVCCQPIQISFSVSEDTIDYINTERTD
ncbi:MAG: CPXCG motif-containing cysteine-rich protein [Pseudomonadota bacterium]